MIKAIRRVTILVIGVGAGFGAGYLKATADLDREAIQELAKIAKDCYIEISEAVRDTVAEQRKQTEIFAETAAAVRNEAANKQTNEQEGETP